MTFTRQRVLLVSCATLVALVVGLAVAVRAWERARLAAFLRIEPGERLTAIEERLGPPEARILEHGELIDLARTGSWICEEVEGDLPGGLLGVFSYGRAVYAAEASDGRLPLPRPRGSVLAYTPSFYLVLVYGSGASTVERVLLCGT